MNRALICLLASGLWLAAIAQPVAPTNEVVRGPFFSSTIRSRYPKVNEAMLGIETMKGIVVTLGGQKKSYVCYDTDLMRVSVGWTGEFLEFGTGQIRIEHPQAPLVRGMAIFVTRPAPGWAKSGSFVDPRDKQQGPLPLDWAKYRGLYQNGRQVVLSYSVVGTKVLEMPAAEDWGGSDAFTRTLNLGPTQGGHLHRLLSLPPESREGIVATKGPDGQAGLLVIPGASRLAVALVGAPVGAGLEVVNNEVCLRLPPLAAAAKFKVAIGVIPAEEDETAIRARVTKLAAPLDLEKLCHGGPALWPEPVVNSGTLGTGDGPYAVDTLTEPLPNPWNAKTFFGGFDFMPDGRMALCTFHGDVWLLSGVDDKLAKLSWRRFATGLFQPLGVKVVDGKIYVLGRDQITIPHDLNGDGEADYYESFNNDTVVTANYHEFCLDLQTDSKGNFYFAKGAPWPPVVTTPHQGTMIKVSKDGSQLEVIASGLRAPNGAAIGPDDQITVSDNQGHWIPSSKLNLIKPGAFYGMMPTAQRSPLPADFEKPMFWLPMSMDNSSGGQAWVTSSKWGPFQNHLLFTSYGKSTLFHVMPQTVDGVTQAAVVQFPLRFNSGLMRCRFNPLDGQLYTCGLKGWQTSGTRDGGLYRVRYTGKKVYMPQDFKVEKGGVRVTFTTELNEASATGVENYALEQWNYNWSGDYGSPELSVNAPGSKGHDIVGLKAAKLSADKKSVFLEISDFKPVMQMKIKFGINAADGTPMNQEIYSTIHRIPAN